MQLGAVRRRSKSNGVFRQKRELRRIVTAETHRRGQYQPPGWRRAEQCLGEAHGCGVVDCHFHLAAKTDDVPDDSIGIEYDRAAIGDDFLIRRQRDIIPLERFAWTKRKRVASHG